MEELVTEIERILINGVDIIKFSGKTCSEAAATAADDPIDIAA
jgi:hypothetical protein